MGGFRFCIKGSLPACLIALLLSGCAGNVASKSGGTKRPASQSYTTGGDSGHAPIRNSGNGEGVESDTGMLVLSGDQVTIQPLSITREERTPVPPVVTRLDDEACVQEVDVCVGTVPVFQHQCRSSCHLCSKCLIDFIGLGCSESVCCTQSCQDVHTGDQCVAWNKQCVKKENHWTETSLFAGLGSPTTSEDLAPMKVADTLLAGLKLRFSYLDASGTRKQVDCPLGEFKPLVSDDRFTFQLREVPGCPSIFVDQPGTPRTLGLINAISASVSYSEGALVKTWDGRILEHPQTTVYHPEIDLSVTVSVQSPPPPSRPNSSEEHGPRGRGM